MEKDLISLGTATDLHLQRVNSVVLGISLTLLGVTCHDASAFSPSFLQRDSIHCLPCVRRTQRSRHVLGRNLYVPLRGAALSARKGSVGGPAELLSRVAEVSLKLKLKSHDEVIDD